MVEMFCCLIESETSHLAILIIQTNEDEMLFILLLSYAALVGPCVSDGSYVMCTAIIIETNMAKISLSNGQMQKLMYTYMLVSMSVVSR